MRRAVPPPACLPLRKLTCYPPSVGSIMTTLEQVKKVVGEVMRVPEGTIDVTARIEDLGESDSLTLAEIATALEMDLGIRVPSEAMVDARSIGDLVALVERLRAADGSRAG